MKKRQNLKRLFYLFTGASMLFSVNKLNAQVTNVESFEGTTFVPTGWTNLNVSGTNTWTRVTAGTSPTQTPHTGVGEAKFNSFSTASGVQALVTPSYDLTGIGSNTATVSFWMYRDNGYNTDADKIDVFMNTTASVVGATSIGTVIRNFTLAPVESAVGWHFYTFNVPGSFNTATNFLILQGTSAFGNNIFIDDVTWISYPPVCSGTPTPGNTISSAVSVCSGIPFSLSLQNVTNGGGVTYQWQSSIDNIIFSNISGEILSTMTTSQSVSTYYKCIVNCGAATGTSTSIQVIANGFENCYCTLTATSLPDTDIGNVTIGTINNGTATPILSNTTANGLYQDYTAITPANLSIGGSIPISLSQITSGATFYGAWFNVFIDYNHNGTFDLPSEQAFTSTVLTDELNPTQTGNIIVPASALSGKTRMRIRLTESGNANNTACGTFGYGEVEDYFVNITCPTIAAPAGIGASTCTNTSTTISVIPGLTGSTLTWYSASTGGTTLATTQSYTTPLLTSSTSYWVSEKIGSCTESTRTDVLATVDPTNVILIPVSTTCNGGSNGTFTLGTVSCGTAPFTYAIDGGSFGTIPTNLSAGTYSVVVKGTGTGNQSSAAIIVTIVEPTLIISVPTAMDTTVCVNSVSALLNTQSVLSTFTLDTLVITFDVLTQPIETNVAPGTQISTATMTSLPAGSIVSSVAFSYPGLTSLGSSFGSDVQIGYTGALHNTAESGINAPFGASTFEFIDSLNIDSLDINGGVINLLYWDSYDDNATTDECTFTTGTTVATLRIAYRYPTQTTVTWWSTPTGGVQIGTGNSMEAIGTSVLPTSTVLGTYNFYAQGENGGCTSDSRSQFTVTLDSPNRTITALTCSPSYTSPFGDTYTTSGLYYHTIPAVGLGCDSTVIIDLTVYAIPTISIQSGTILTASSNGASTTYQWLNCTTGNSVIPNATTSTYTATVNGMYSVISTLGNCSDTSACVTVNSVELENLNNSTLLVKLSPNPTSDKVQVTFTSISSASIVVYDLQGKIISILNEVTSGDLISLEGVQPGIYMIKVISEEGNSSHRIIKN